MVRRQQKFRSSRQARIVTVKGFQRAGLKAFIADIDPCCAYKSVVDTPHQG
jgi:hypothetical protein